MTTSKSNKSAYGVFAGLVAGLIGFLAVCGIIGYQIMQKLKPEKAEEVVAKQIWVKTVPVCLGTIEKKIQTTGDVQPWEEVKISAKMPGKVKVVGVDEGDRVSAGQVVVELETTELETGLRQALAAVAAARAAAEQAQLGLANQEREFERTQGLFKENLISEQQYQSTELMVLSTRAQVEMAKASVAQAEAALEFAETRMKDSKIASPISGIVVSRSVNEGEMLQPTMPFMRVMDMSRLKVVASVVETEIGDVKEGILAKVTLVGERDVAMEGKVYSIAPINESGSHSYQVTIEVQNPPEQVKAGMSALVNVVTDRRDNVLLVPKDAVTRKEDDTVCYIVDDQSIARFRKVRVPAEDDVNCQVEGLQEGDRAILITNFEAVDGIKVTEKAEEVLTPAKDKTPVPVEKSS